GGDPAVKPMPRVAISMGDPTGIGPEVTLAALCSRPVRSALIPILVGDPAVYADTARQLRLSLRFVDWTPPAPLPRDGIAVHAVAALRPQERRPGRPSAAGGRAAYEAILAALGLVHAGLADALATAPISKANLAAAGVGATG